MDNTYCVYIHINKFNGKVYIGQTKLKPEERWHNGLGYKTQIFYRAIEKYGWDNFEHKVLHSNLTREQANKIEVQLIAEYQSNNCKYGYNISSGGNNREKSEEGIRHFRELMTGHEVSEETRKILSEKCSGWHHTDKARKAISNANQGRKWFNDGVNNVWCFECPDGYTDGMLPMSQNGKNNIGKAFKEMKWFNNGEIEARAKECPDGFSEGRLKTVDYITSQKTCKKVKCLNTGQVYNSIAEASRELELDKKAVSYCCRGKYKQTKGFRFAFVEEVA